MLGFFFSSVFYSWFPLCSIHGDFWGVMTAAKVTKTDMDIFLTENSRYDEIKLEFPKLIFKPHFLFAQKPTYTNITG